MHKVTETFIGTHTGSGWETFSLSSWIPSTATGAIIRIRNIDGTDLAPVGWRKTGSTDSRVYDLVQLGHVQVFVGVNGSRQADFYWDGVGNVGFYVMGYFEAECVFFDNAVSKTPSAGSTWTTADISAQAGSDTVQIVFGQSGSQTLGVRRNGSTHTPIGSNDAAGRPQSVMCPCNSSGQFQIYTDNSSTPVWIMGYMKYGATVYADAVDLAYGSPYGWQTRTTDVAPAGSPQQVYALLQCDMNGAQYYAGRQTGTTEINETLGSGLQAWVVQTNTSAQYDIRDGATGTITVFYEVAIIEIDAPEPPPGDPRYAWPVADLLQGDWTPSSGGTLYPMVDERDASPEDADYIWIVGTGSCELDLSTINPDPGTSDGHVLRIRAKRETASQSLRVTLIQNGSPGGQIAQWTQALTASFVTYEFTLSAGETDSINDYSNLSVRIETI